MIAAWPRNLVTASPLEGKDWAARVDSRSGKGFTIDYMMTGNKITCRGYHHVPNPIELNWNCPGVALGSRPLASFAHLASSDSLLS